MALTRQQKADQLHDLKTKIEKSTSIVFAHYIGLGVSDVTDLRGKLRARDAEMKVAKKTLMHIALKELNFPAIPEETLDGPVACIFSYSDPIAGAQVAKAFAKDHDKVALIGGVFDGKVLSKREAVEFASIPSREVLLATFAGMIRSPLTSFAGMVSSPLSGFARALSEYGKKNGSPAAA